MTAVKKRVIVIGAGVAGLSAGIYAQKCGFNVTILESHSMAGGFCTAWKRNGYLFEGGMHWLTGSRPQEPLHKIWRYVGALDDSVKVHYPEPFLEFNHNGEPIRFYRDINATREHFLAIAPEDKKAIDRLYKDVRKVQKLVMPIFNISGLKMSKRKRNSLFFLLSALSGVKHYERSSSFSREDYINQFTHPGLRNLLQSYSRRKIGIAHLLLTLGNLARGDGGFPEGGSLPFIGRMVQTFTSLGGEISYNTRADRVIMEDGRASAVLCGDTRLPADAVIITGDTMAIDHLFATPPQGAWLEEMRAVTMPMSATFISLGIGVSLKKYPKNGTIKLEKRISAGNMAHEFLLYNNYAADPVYSPQGKTALTVHMAGDTYDFWKQAQEENRYEEEKRKLAEDVIEALSIAMPEMAGKVEVTDVATPLTNERYCASWKGSWMTEATPGMSMKQYPAVIEGLKGVYFAGQRMRRPGGLPVAAMSGRRATQYLCRDTGTVFVSEE